MTTERLAHLQAQLADEIEALTRATTELRARARRPGAAYYAIEDRLRRTLRDIRFTLERDAAPIATPEYEITVFDGPLWFGFRIE